MNTADSVIVVDDDIGNLKIAGTILSENGMQVTAVSSGSELIRQLEDGARPDLIMLDVIMPGMDGFETYEALRCFEKEHGMDETPVVFLTADESRDTEAKGFDLGALDFIRKPFESEILIHRIQNILNNSRRINILAEEASIDQLTGILNKASVTTELERACKKSGGALLILDLDSFKLVNDIYGHEAGDRVLSAFAGLIKHHFRSNDIVGRIGGDEFIAFLKNINDRDAIIRSINRLNSRFLAESQKILGDDMPIPLGVSAGAVMTLNGNDYELLFDRADQSLRYIKQNGKHGCFIWVNEENSMRMLDPAADDLHKVNMILDERNVSSEAMLLGQETFGSVYRYMLRYIKRYKQKGYKLLFTLSPVSEDVRDDEFQMSMDEFSDVLQDTLRNSDIIMQSSSSQFFLLLPMVCTDDIRTVIDRVLSNWNESGKDKFVTVSCEYEPVFPEDISNEDIIDENEDHELNIVVVDDDIMILKQVGSILSDDGMWVTALDSGEALLEFIAKGNLPDLILMDVMMPDPDGFETYEKMQHRLGPGKTIPVIFLTGNNDEETELKGLELGAADFIRKPIKAKTLPMRVRHALELLRSKK